MWKSTVNDYEVCETGEIRNKKGKLLGWYYNTGYKGVGSKNKYLVHRLVAEAFIPNPDNLPYVDHINGIRDDNRVENLRWASYSQNGMNSTMSKNNKAGIKGIWKDTRYKKPWTAQIHKDRKTICIGHFDTMEEAIEARQIKAIELFGVFCRENEP